VRRRRYVWTYRSWGLRRPMLGMDEFGSHTLVIPWPVANDRSKRPPGASDLWELLGFEADYKALAFVVAPWWFTPKALRKDYREWGRWRRAYTRFEATLPNPCPAGSMADAEAAWRAANPEPPEPKAFQWEAEAEDETLQRLNEHVAASQSNPHSKYKR
jgi:hypothetical protein